MDNQSIITLNMPTVRVAKSQNHTPSIIQADTLFTFTPKLEFLVPYIKTQIISPRYCVEDISYLKIPNLKKIAFPMKCFCDINLHRLDVHLEWYGYYGLAFSKQWGMNRGIQPVQYINPNSELRKDFTRAFSAALSAPISKKSSATEEMKSYLLHEMMYYKPYEGKMENRNTGKKTTQCFTDECEWRYNPDVTVVVSTDETEETVLTLVVGLCRSIVEPVVELGTAPPLCSKAKSLDLAGCWLADAFICIVESQTWQRLVGIHQVEAVGCIDNIAIQLVLNHTVGNQLLLVSMTT